MIIMILEDKIFQWKKVLELIKDNQIEYIFHY